jgi:hypothetical protein
LDDKGELQRFPFIVQMCRDTTNVQIAAQLVILIGDMSPKHARPVFHTLHTVIEGSPQIILELCAQIAKCTKEQSAQPFFNLLSQMCVQRATSDRDLFTSLIAEQVSSLSHMRVCMPPAGVAIGGYKTRVFPAMVGTRRTAFTHSSRESH